MDKIETTPMGTRRHSFVGKKGDLRVEMHYADLATFSPTLAGIHAHCGREACLYIFKANAPKEGTLLPMCQMWAFDPRATSKRTGDPDQRRIAFAAKNLCKALYGIESQSDEFRIYDLLWDYLGDLKDHPPETGMDQSLDEWLASLEDQGLEFYAELNGQRII